MDKPSTSRYAAYLHGRGGEYDETVAARAEALKQIGEAPATAASHAHSHSPLADPAVYKRRRAAALGGKKPPSPSP